METVEVMLSKGCYGLAYVDDEDYELVSKYKWYVQRSHGKHITSVVAKVVKGDKRTTIAMHRLILGLTHRNIHVDHIDRNPLNNQRSNLRTCSITENNYNRKRKDSDSYKGVYKRTDKNYKKPYTVSIKFEGIRVNVSEPFETEEEAARVYDKLAKKLHGEFASLNFPE